MDAKPAPACARCNDTGKIYETETPSGGTFTAYCDRCLLGSLARTANPPLSLTPPTTDLVRE